jgi:hypothetical protein
MQAEVREHQYVKAGAALAAAGVVALAPLAPVTPLPSPMSVVERAVRLVADEDSLLNIPLNLFYDFVNIPYNEVQGVDTVASSLMFGDNFFVVGAANLFGIDPGDPTHVDSILSLLLPFPELTQGFGGLAFEETGLLAAELPISASCSENTCFPLVPALPVTNYSDLDRLLGFGQAVDGQTPLGLFNHWFGVPLTGPDSLSTGFTFDPTQTLAPGVHGYDGADALFEPQGGGPVYPGLGFSNDPAVNGGNYFLGGTVVPNATDPSAPGTAPAEVTPAAYADATELPWAGHTFTLNLALPFQNFLNSLEAPPSTDGISGADGIAVPGTGIELPSLTDFVQALQAFAASLVVAFNPFQPGSPACPGDCDIFGGSGLSAGANGSTLGITLPLVKDINALDPSNTLVNEYLTAVANGTANIPNQQDVDDTAALLRTGGISFPHDMQVQILDMLGGQDSPLAHLLVNAGVLTDPAFIPATDADYTSPAPLGDDPTSLYGGLNPTLVIPDLEQLLGPGSDAVLNTPGAEAAVNGFESIMGITSGAGLESLLNVATFGL